MLCVDVIFRRKRNGEIIAVFPEIPVDITGELCEGFSSLDKKVTVDYKQLRYHSKLATKDEYKELYETLSCLGYNLGVVNKFSSNYKKIRLVRVQRELGD